MDLISGNRIDLDYLQYIPEFSVNPEARAAVYELIKQFPDYEIIGEMPEDKTVDAEQHIERSEHKKVEIGDVYKGFMGYEVVTSYNSDLNQFGVQIFSDKELTKVAGGGGQWEKRLLSNKYTFLGKVEDIRGDKAIEYPSPGPLYDPKEQQDLWYGIKNDDFETRASDYERHAEAAQKNKPATRRGR